MRTWIEKQRNIIDFTLSSLARRKGKNIALILVYVLLVFLLASVLFFTQALKREASLLLKNAPDVVVQRMAAGRHDVIPRDYLNVLQTIRGASKVYCNMGTTTSRQGSSITRLQPAKATGA